MKFKMKNSIPVFVLLFIFSRTFAQLSPGELSNAHAHLEGLSNCTKCHVLGEKETTPKCLECHKEIQLLINNSKGYHSSEDVKGNDCANCHGEHYGRDFKLIDLEEEYFEHSITGYKLEGKHGKIECKDCHKKEFIQNNISQKKSGNTYLGLGTTCLSCHDDYHQNTFSEDCKTCHNQEAFKPAPGFNHAETKFPLIGKHQSVSCEKCHKIEARNGKPFQQFSGIPFSTCSNCHEDVHKNRFGNDCRKCHNEFSFHEVKQLGSFNHDKTDFSLKGKHQNVDCKKCHKTGSYTRPLSHSRCLNCHVDYHEKQLERNGITPDCIECHSVDGFSPSSYGIEQHNRSGFKLESAHLATPCFVCHKKEEKWDFGISGDQCTDCHKNIHEKYMDMKYIPNGDCKTCHSISTWNKVTFNHNITDFKLIGKHTQVTCKECHFRQITDKETVQQYTWEIQECTNCHTDAHFGQFAINGVTTCERCHTNNGWEAEKFNHNSARFKLDGKHKDLACALCHKSNSDINKKYVVYKFEDITCASCH